MGAISWQTQQELSRMFMISPSRESLTARTQPNSKSSHIGCSFSQWVVIPPGNIPNEGPSQLCDCIGDFSAQISCEGTQHFPLEIH